MKRICVIGGGSSGLVAIKECLAGGFQVDCFEKTDNLGGLWRYREDDVHGIASVMKSTIINSSKEMSSFSDFQPPADFPNFMHNNKMVKYFELYAEKFDLLKHMKLRHEVLSVTRAPNYDETAQWSVTVRNLEDNQSTTATYDGVLVCTGHHTFPLTPQFPGQDLFQGQVFHSHSYKTPKGFEDKTVVVLGIGNSAGDLAVELSSVAGQVYLATRSGSWITNRIGPKGYPIDAKFVTRMVNVLRDSGLISLDKRMASVLNERFDHAMYNVRPKHQPTAQHVMVNDVLPNRIASGTVIMKSSIERFTPNGVIFEGETIETKCDVVIMATGYKFYFPFFNSETEPMLVPDDENRIDLYKYVFPPTLPHAHTLGFVGLIQPIGAIFPISELHVRWFVQLNLAKCKPLPPVAAMLADVRDKRAQLSARYIGGSRHTVQVDWLPYMDEIASQFNVKPNLWKYLLTDYPLWKMLLFGPCVPAQYRLTGPGAWSGARQALLTVDDRIRAAFQTRSTSVQDTKEAGFSKLWAIFIAVILSVLVKFVF
ncbi:Flavin-containing monooxygenase 5 [Halotydeus destructor]|nr:Flavin-containing monooxygenase 5 [Halotydeus destructor]